MQKQLSCEYYEMLEELQATDFTLVELTLYLDTHPNDSHAIKQFNQFSEYSQQQKARFEERFGPLQQFGNSSSGERWDWNTEPWPWQV